MKELFKRVHKLETQNELSYEVLAKLHQPIFNKIIRQAGYFGHYGKYNPAYELTKRDEKICELHEKAVRADPALYEASIYKIYDGIEAKKMDKFI